MIYNDNCNSYPYLCPRGIYLSLYFAVGFFKVGRVFPWNVLILSIYVISIYIFLASSNYTVVHLIKLICLTIILIDFIDSMPILYLRLCHITIHNVPGNVGNWSYGRHVHVPHCRHTYNKSRFDKLLVSTTN